MRSVFGFIFAWCVAATPAFAAEAMSLYAFSKPAEKQAFDVLTQSMRCLTCQNQNIADSQAPMAQDLRRYIAKRLRSGDQAAVIRADLLARYGESISFAPIWHGTTALLWLLPALLMALVCWRLLRGHPGASLQKLRR